MDCPYCGEEAEWIENKEIYGKNYGRSYMCYYCKKCDARVGCHNNTRAPLGTMANKELRRWRIEAHRAIDPIWKRNRMRRWEVYGALSKAFNKEIHVGESDIEMCKKIIEFVHNKFGLQR